MSNLVLLEVSAGCATLTLNRPERRNALTKEMLLALKKHLEALNTRDDIRVICLEGAQKTFCAGQDLNERDPRIHAHPLDLEALQEELFHPVVTLLHETPKMTVAKVRGVAAGAGVGLALACDIVVASEDATFSFAFSNVGLSSDTGVAWQLLQSLGPARTKAALLLGHSIGGSEAARIGMVASAIPTHKVDTEVDHICRHLAQGPKTAQQSIKKTIEAAQSEACLAQFLKVEAKMQGIAGRDPDYTNAVLAFLEKRTVTFDGR